MKKLIALAALLFAGQAFGQACTTTLNAGANVLSAIQSAAAGATICLNNGTYSAFTTGAITKSPPVTVRAVNQHGALFSGQVIIGSQSLSGASANGLTFDGIDLQYVYVGGPQTKNITFRNYNITGQVIVDYISGSNTNPNIVFEYFTHNNITACTAPNARMVFFEEGQTYSNPVVTVRGGMMDGGSADGIQTGIRILVENTTIKNLAASPCPTNADPHTDAFQFYGGPFNGTIVRNNYFINNQQVLSAYDGIAGVLIENNVFDPGSSWPRECQIELYSDRSSTVRHNTILTRNGAGSICLDRKVAQNQTAGSGTIIQNNIARSIQQNNGSTAAVVENNLVVSGSGGTNGITGTPTYIGGALPSTWAGFALAPSSLGVNGATDGTNIGSLYFGEAVPATIKPNPPTGVVVTDNSDHLGWFAQNWTH